MRDLALEAKNKRIVLAFYDAALNRHDYDEAVGYLAPDYVQHNPTSKDGIAGFRGFIDMIRKDHPKTHVDTIRSFADGDHVILHNHAVFDPGTPGLAVVDIYRVRDGKIVEHWDVVQPVPEKSANENGMFASANEA